LIWHKIEHFSKVSSLGLTGRRALATILRPKEWDWAPETGGINLNVFELFIVNSRSVPKQNRAPALRLKLSISNTSGKKRAYQAIDGA